MKTSSAQLLAPLFVVLVCTDISSAFTTSISSSTARQSHATRRFSKPHSDDNDSLRREVLSCGVASLVSLVTSAAQPTNAFSNKISEQYDDRPKRRGPQPKDLGVGKRKDMIGDEYIGLKPCGPAPNCFCSTDDQEDDPEHNIPAWIWPKNLDKTQAFQEIEKAVNDYQPGQGNIDGGGFEIKESRPGYLYAQFESLKQGYIDDVEFAFIDGKDDENAVQVRSSSRIGYLDFGVNAKRLNYIAKSLKASGWTAPGVDFSTHRDYAIQNNVQ